MSYINKTICEKNEKFMFVTFFIGVLDLPTGLLRFCNAGHNPPAILTPNKNEVKLIDVNHNIPLGVAENFEFKMQEQYMEAGQSIFLYTDGLTEAGTMDEELFGENRMIKVLQSVQEETPKEQIKAMQNKISDFMEGALQNDDLTMLAIHYLRKENEILLHRQISIGNKIIDLKILPEFIESIADEVNLDSQMAMNLNLALDEVVTNAVMYAYPKGMNGTIDIECLVGHQRIKFIIKDNGVAFDPTTVKEPDLTSSVEERKIGGLGIYLVRKLMDSVNYERVNGQNILTLRKKINTTSPC